MTIPLRAEDLAYWSEARHGFVLEEGTVNLMIGAASDNIRLNGTIEVR